MTDARYRVMFTLVACLVVMLPVPYWVFDGCRTRYILKNRVLSKDVELVGEDGEAGDGEDSVGMQLEQFEGGSKAYSAKVAMN